MDNPPENKDKKVVDIGEYQQKKTDLLRVPAELSKKRKEQISRSFYEMALKYEKEGFIPDAIKNCRDALEIMPDFTEASDLLVHLRSLL